MFSNGKTIESGYPIGDPSRMMLRYIDAPDAPGSGGTPDPGEFRTVAGEGAGDPPAAPPAAAPPAADPEPAPAATPPAAPKAGEAPTAPPAAPPATKPWGDDKDFDPEKAWNLIQNLRNDKATNEQKIATARAEATTTAQKDLVTKWAKELGVIEEPKDPEALLTSVTAERDSTSKENRLLKVENRVYKHAGALGADLDAVLDSRELERKFLEIDPSADDFDSQVETIVREAVDKNPARYKKAQVASVSGGDFTSGNSGGPKDPDPADDDIEEARKAAAKRKENRF